VLIDTGFVNDAFNESLCLLLDEYANQREPISVDFRKLVTDVTFGSRATHLIHTYPAKLLPHIPYFFLNNDVLSIPGDDVLDPFCGSGTVLLESLLAGRNAYGVDANPVARLITKVKTTSVDVYSLKRHTKFLLSRIKAEPTLLPPDVINIDYWFYPHVIKQLSAIKEAIEKTRNEVFRDFYLVCFSNCVKKVSLADPRLSVPVRLKNDQCKINYVLRETTAKHLRKLEKIDVIQEFSKIISMNIKRFTSFIEMLPKNVQASIISDDARTVDLSLANEKDIQSLDLIITSPPYAGAQKYIRSSSLSIGWLGMCDTQSLKSYEELNIGREHYSKGEYCELIVTGIKEADEILNIIFEKNPLRAHIAGKYLIEMREAFISSTNSLKRGGYMVLIAANNTVCGYDFKTQEYLRQIIESLGFETMLRLVDDIHSRGLMTKRNKTASIISCEWVMVFKKK
jgi:tRNA G10  N-methylase Trm11